MVLRLKNINKIDSGNKYALKRHNIVLVLFTVMVKTITRHIPMFLKFVFDTLIDQTVLHIHLVSVNDEMK